MTSQPVQRLAPAIRRAFRRPGEARLEEDTAVEAGRAEGGATTRTEIPWPRLGRGLRGCGVAGAAGWGRWTHRAANGNADATDATDATDSTTTATADNASKESQ
jgi:hypothetical protein